MSLELPISLEDGVKIISRSGDGVFLISYPKPGGETGYVHWPDQFRRYRETHAAEGRAVNLVRDYLFKHFDLDYRPPGREESSPGTH